MALLRQPGANYTEEKVRQGGGIPTKSQPNPNQIPTRSQPNPNQIPTKSQPNPNQIPTNPIHILIQAPTTLNNTLTRRNNCA
eukprot:5807199-Prymnesium_polylepis.1